MFSLMLIKHLFLRTPAQSWTPIIPKIKKTKKHNNNTFPSIGRVSNRSITNIRIPEKKNRTIVYSKIYENRCKQTLASLAWFWACRWAQFTVMLNLLYRLLHRVAVNSHALPVHKKNRITSLLFIFQTTVIKHFANSLDPDQARFRAWFGSKLFYTQRTLRKSWFWQKVSRRQKHAKYLHTWKTEINTLTHFCRIDFPIRIN